MEIWFLIIVGVFSAIGLLCGLDTYIKHSKWTTWRCLLFGHKIALIDGIWSEKKEKCCERCHLILDDKNPVKR